MFKVKKHSKRALPDRIVLLETNNNEISQPLLHEKPYKRAQSVRPQRKQVSQQQLQPIETPSQQLSHTLISQPPQPKIYDRESVSEEVRRTSAMMFKDKMVMFGVFKEEMIRRVAQKCLVMTRPQNCERKDWIESMIDKEMVRLQLVKQTNAKYQRSLSRIQEMLAQRLTKLSTFR